MSYVAPQSGHEMVEERQTEQRGLNRNVGKVTILSTPAKGTYHGKIHHDQSTQARQSAKAA